MQYQLTELSSQNFKEDRHTVIRREDHADTESAGAALDFICEKNNVTVFTEDTYFILFEH